jgi:hypothetical protein
MDLDLHHILQFNLDFGPDAIQTQLPWKLHSLSLYTREVWASVWEGVYKQSISSNCSQEANKIDFIVINSPLLQITVL